MPPLSVQDDMQDARLRTLFEDILAPAIDCRAPYAKQMVSALLDAAIRVLTPPSPAGVITDEMVTRALNGFDTGTGDPNDYRKRMRAALEAANLRAPTEPAEDGAPDGWGEKLWLWKNFVDGRPEYWAFSNPYPCHRNGDPMVLGEPCGFGLVKQSVNGRPKAKEADVMRAMLSARPTASSDGERARAVVQEQADDWGLWCVPESVMEDLLQKALRRLHEAVEGKSATECAIDALASTQPDSAGV